MGVPSSCSLIFRVSGYGIFLLRSIAAKFAGDLPVGAESVVLKAVHDLLLRGSIYSRDNKFLNLGKCWTVVKCMSVLPTSFTCLIILSKAIK